MTQVAASGAFLFDPNQALLTLAICAARPTTLSTAPFDHSKVSAFSGVYSSQPSDRGFNVSVWIVLPIARGLFLSWQPGVSLPRLWRVRLWSVGNGFSSEPCRQFATERQLSDTFGNSGTD